MDFTIAEENVLDDGHVWCILVTGPLTLKDLLKDEAKGRGSQVPRATEIRIPEALLVRLPMPREYGSRLEGTRQDMSR